MLRNVSKARKKIDVFLVFLMHHLIHSAACKFLHSLLGSSRPREFVKCPDRGYLLTEDEDRMFVFGFASMHVYGAYLKGLVLGKFSLAIFLKKLLHLHHQCM